MEALDLTVAPAPSWSAVRSQAGLLDLVDHVQVSEPYSYRPGEVASPEEWFPPLVDRSDLTLLAYRPGDRPVGYCVAIGLVDYPAAAAAELGVEPASTVYLAELAVSPGVRRRGIASTLLDLMTERSPSGTTAWVIRTLANNAPAIALYRRHGFEVVPGVTELRHGRTRVYLVRHAPRTPRRST